MGAHSPVRSHATLLNTTTKVRRRSTYVPRVADSVPPPAPMPVTEVESANLLRGIRWAFAFESIGIVVIGGGAMAAGFAIRMGLHLMGVWQ